MILKLKFIDRNSGEIVPLVNVLEYDGNTFTGNGVAANVNGIAEIDKLKMPLSLRASSVGYYTEMLGAPPAQNTALPLEIVLTPKIEGIPTVEIVTPKSRKFAYLVALILFFALAKR